MVSSRFNDTLTKGRPDELRQEPPSFLLESIGTSWHQPSLNPATDHRAPTARHLAPVAIRSLLPAGLKSGKLSEITRSPANLLGRSRVLSRLTSRIPHNVRPARSKLTDLIAGLFWCDIPR